MRLYSWNINGLRAGLKKGTFLDFISRENPDILCLQEVKAKPDDTEIDLPDYQEIWNSATRPGYSGTAIFTKIAPESYTNTIPDTILKNYTWSDEYGDVLEEGRIQTAEFPHFYLVNLYVPNAKRDLTRLSLREKVWDAAILEYINYLQNKKPVVVCGDFNVAHQSIDLARPKDNQKNAGFTVEERQGMTNYLDQAHLLDTFRTLHPTEIKYSWWSHWANARARNIGWRIDYFLISKQLQKHLQSADILCDYLGSDHCPITIDLEF